MGVPLLSFVDAESLAVASARYIAERARYCVNEKGSFTLALSGGRTPQAMLAYLATLDVPWRDVTIFQVDERVAPDGDVGRNATSLKQSLQAVHPTLLIMDVNSSDLFDAAWRYTKMLPAHFDLVHLGLGADGHTASLTVEGLSHITSNQLIALSEPFAGYQRMTMTPSALARALQVLWVVSGEDKAPVLAQLLRGDRAIAATHLVTANSLVMADEAALGSHD
jgi:6-phosphogluconolactonase